MQSADLKLERLLNLTALLVDAPRPVGAEEIHRQVYGYPERFESFRRAFERDKDELREMGVTIELRRVADAENRSGYVIPSTDFHLPDPGLTIEERVALQLALSLVKMDGSAAGPSTSPDPLAKLGGRETGVAGSEPIAEIAVTPLMTGVFEAIAERRPVSFHYRTEERTVHPYRMDFQRGRWYLTGHDVDRGATRVFRLDRVDDATVEAGERLGFERPDHVAGLRLEPWRHGDDPPVTAVLAVDQDAAPAVREMLGPDATWTAAGDDAWRVEVEVTDRAAFRSAVVALLDAVEVIEPDSLRDEVVAWLGGLVAAPAVGT